MLGTVKRKKQEELIDGWEKMDTHFHVESAPLMG